MAKQLIVPGHGLIGEGAPHTGKGVRMVGFGSVLTTGPGHAKCSCGKISEDMLHTTAARKRWHVSHKADRLLYAYLVGDTIYRPEIKLALDAVAAGQTGDPQSVVGILTMEFARITADRAQGKPNVIDEFTARFEQMKKILDIREGACDEPLEGRSHTIIDGTTQAELAAELPNLLVAKGAPMEPEGRST